MAGAGIDPKQADAPYWEGLGNGKLRIQKCDCSAWQWPAVFRCSDCGRWDPPWRDVATSGKIFSWTRTFQAFPGLESFGLPFVNVLVELDDAGGTRLMGVLADGDGEIAIGDCVKGEIIERTMHGATMPTVVWRL
jgi:uncharacterized OB-fold protein